MHRLIISIFLLSAVLLGCGQKGDLYIPQNDAVAQSVPETEQEKEQQAQQAAQNAQQDERKNELQAE